MKRNLIDASQLELEDKVVSIKRVTKVVKGETSLLRTCVERGGAVRSALGHR